MGLLNVLWWTPLGLGAYIISALFISVMKTFRPRFSPLQTSLPKEFRHDFAAKRTVDLSAPSPNIIQGSNILCYNPLTGQIFGTCPILSKGEVESAIDRAVSAQKIWASTTTYKDRCDLLKLLLDFVISHQEDICRASRLDTGKTMIDGALGEVLTTCEKLRWTMRHGTKVLAMQRRATGPLLAYKSAWVEYHPLGVIGALVSWNYPFHNVFGPMISALFAGNAFVVKVSEHVSFSAIHYFQRIIHDALRTMNQPVDLVQFLTGDASTGDALVRSPKINKIIFIGSPQVGRLVMRNASETLTPVVLELGGKDPAILLEDADLNQAIPILMRGVFQNSGQNCVGIERIIIHQAIYNEVVQLFENQVKSLRCFPSENDSDCGAITMGQRQRDHIVSLIDDAEKKGARILIDGRKCNKTNSFINSHTLNPTMIVDVSTNMKIAQEEVFGPVMVLMKAMDDEDVIRLVNQCPYGLGSAIFSRNVQRAKNIVRQLDIGMANINDFAVNYLCQSLPFGGVKVSGFDRFAGEEGLKGCCRLVSMTADAFPFIKTILPKVMQYPMDVDAAWQFSKGLIHLIYDGNIIQKIKAIGLLLTLKRKEPIAL